MIVQKIHVLIFLELVSSVHGLELINYLEASILHFNMMKVIINNVKFKLEEQLDKHVKNNVVVQMKL
jgi:hypothetical protein